MSNLQSPAEQELAQLIVEALNLETVAAADEFVCPSLALKVNESEPL